jgi:hypothetical protein
MQRIFPALAILAGFMMFLAQPKCSGDEERDRVARKQWKQLSELRENPPIRIVLRLRESKRGFDHDEIPVSWEHTIEDKRGLEAFTNGISLAKVNPPSSTVSYSGLVPLGEIVVETASFKQRILFSKVGFLIDDGDTGGSSVNRFYSLLLAEVLNDTIVAQGGTGLDRKTLDHMSGEFMRAYQLELLKAFRAK